VLSTLSEDQPDPSLFGVFAGDIPRFGGSFAALRLHGDDYHGIPFVTSARMLESIQRFCFQVLRARHRGQERIDRITQAVERQGRNAFQILAGIERV